MTLTLGVSGTAALRIVPAFNPYDGGYAPNIVSGPNAISGTLGGATIAGGGQNTASSSAASGGFTLMPGSGSCTLTSGGVGWNCSSDRNLKENFTTVNGKELLAALMQIPITQWNVKGAIAQYIGPMAQDFYAAFHLGEDAAHINTVDAQGVALAAIQGLYEVVQEKARDLASAANAERAEQRSAV